MHSKNRFLVLALLCVAAAPAGLSLTASVDPITRDQAQEQLQQALIDARDGYRQSANIDQTQRVNERVADASEETIRQLAKKERDLRLRISVTMQMLGKMDSRSAQLLGTEQRMLRASADQKQQLTDFIRAGYVRLAVIDTGPVAGRTVFRRLFGTSLGASVDADLRDEALIRARTQLMTALADAQVSADRSQRQLATAAGDLGKQLADLQAQREQTLMAYADAVHTHDRAVKSLQLSDAELQEIQRETAEVQSEVLKMQGELAQIDARLKVRAERALIQKGLLSDRPDRFKQQSAAGGRFAWPAHGPVSAGFHDAAYQKFFRVPHQGMDIVVPQGTPVSSAADGVVFLARDGGATGFSYILIGHRDGYATLYGHLSSFAVHTGDYVTQGQIIGYSGGRPGTHGAGPMTTAAHLHFEMLQYGTHLNPRPMLP
jgi:murein DD-endopeptidase MepM/ murein hydrolase activator NlpD